MTLGNRTGSHCCSEEVSSAQQVSASGSGLSANYRQPCVYVKPSPLVIPQHNCDVGGSRPDSARDQNRGRKRLQDSSSCSSEASFSSHPWPERHKAIQRSVLSPVVTNVPSPAFRCLFTSEDDMGIKQPALQHNSNWCNLVQANTSSTCAAEPSPHRKGIEQWLDKMESQMVSRARSASHTPAGTPKPATAGIAVPAEGPGTPGADLPAPAFVLMGLLSS